MLYEVITHTGNVGRLEVAWTYATGDARPGGRSQIQCNPIVVDSVLFASSPGLKIFALHAATEHRILHLARGEETGASAQPPVRVSQQAIFAARDERNNFV